MSSNSPTIDERWWLSAENDFPSAFFDDQRRMENQRFSSLLTPNPKLSDAELCQRLRRAVTLLEIAAFDEELEKHGKSKWKFIALTHEALGIIQPESIARQWLLSAVAWQIACAPAVAGQLANHLFKNQLLQQQSVFERIVAAFAYRDFGLLERLAAEAVKTGENIRTEALESSNVWQGAEAAMLLSLGQTVKDLVDYVEFRAERPPDPQFMSDFISFSRKLNDAWKFRVGRFFSVCLENFVLSSSRYTIEAVAGLNENTKNNLQKYLRQYPELWVSQKEAIDKGLLDADRKHFVVAVPTSSGKTLCGEIAIIQQITENPNATCFYVVPTRALVEEKGNELQRKLQERFGIKVASATGALQNDEIEASLLSGSQVIVCTPEKLDLLIRHDDTILANASLFVVDESHLINDTDRGLGLEFVVVKLLLLKPEARILMLSAMIPNSEDFGRWLASENSVCSSEWRPTRQKFGEITFVDTKPRGTEMILRLYDDQSFLDNIEISLQEFRRKPHSIAEQVIWAVQALRERGPVLVFCMSKSRCEKIAEEIVEYLQEENRRLTVFNRDHSDVPPKVEALRRKIRREVAQEFLLYDALKFGVAYHHADLPPRIRIDLERLIAEGFISVVISTTTLAEGVNLPISTVIYEDWKTHVDPRAGQQSKPLDLSKFRNIAGRAGRAGKESEGLILFLNPERKPIQLPNGRNIAPRQWFLRKEYPPIKSRFLEIVEDYRVPTDELLNAIWQEGDTNSKIIPAELRSTMRQFGLAVLHAVEVLKELNDETLVERVVDLSLLAIQSPEQTPIAKQWFRRWVDFYRRAEVEREELRPIAMQVGLPLRAIQRLYARMIEDTVFRDLFGEQSNSSLRLSPEQTQAAASFIAGIQELDLTPSQAPHVELIQEWLNGLPIWALEKKYSPYLQNQTRRVEQTCNYAIKQLSNSGAWGAYAITRVLQLIVADEISPLAKRLPLFMYFGVNSTPAVLFCLMGIERIDSIRLGLAYLADNHSTVSVKELKAWAERMPIEQIERILAGDDQREIDGSTLTILAANLKSNIE